MHRVAGRGLAGVVGGDDIDFQRLAAGLRRQRGVAVGDGVDVDGDGVHTVNLFEHAVARRAGRIAPMRQHGAGGSGGEDEAVRRIRQVDRAGFVQAKGQPERVGVVELLAEFADEAAQTVAQSLFGGVAEILFIAGIRIAVGGGDAGGGQRGEQHAGLRGSDHQLGRVDFVAGVGGEKVFERNQQRLAFGLRGGHGGGEVGKASGGPGLVPVFAQIIGEHAAGGTDEGFAVGIGHDDGGAEIGLGAQRILVIGLRGDGSVQVGAHVHFEVLAMSSARVKTSSSGSGSAFEPILL